MGNFPALPGYPYGLKDPLPHGDVNQASEQMQKTVNAEDGSAHAPAADIEWSGASSGGFSFSTADPFPFYGKLDVSNGLYCTAPISGFVRFESLVAIDVFGGLTFKSPTATCNFESGAICTFASGATLTMASGSTTNLTGAVNVRGTVTLKSTANGGPGHLVLETDTDITINSGATVENSGTINHLATAIQAHSIGSTITGLVTREAREVRSGVAARTNHRAAATLGDANANASFEQDHYRLPITITATRTITVLDQGAYAPSDGEQIRFSRTGDTTPSAVFSIKIIREVDSKVLFTFYASRQGFCVVECVGGAWELAEGAQFVSGTSGYYDDVW